MHLNKMIFLLLIILPGSFVKAQVLSPMQKNETGKDGNTNLERVTFYGLTSLNSANDDLAENITASGRLAVQFVVTPDKRLNINVGANLLNANPSKGIKKDSVDFNSLMFPETGNFGFLFNPSYVFSKRDVKESAHIFSLDGSFAYRKVTIDSPAVSFKINSVNLGIKYTLDYNKNTDENRFIFSLLGYWNLFNVPDEDVKRFNSIMTDSLFEKVNKGAAIHSVGLKTTVQYKSFIFFADLRRNLRTKELSDDNPFKGTKFNIGFATMIKLKGF